MHSPYLNVAVYMTNFICITKTNYNRIDVYSRVRDLLINDNIVFIILFIKEKQIIDVIVGDVIFVFIN